MTTTLEQAPTHVKVAIDLIMLLEESEIPEEEVLLALEIIKNDYKNKLSASQQ